MKQRIPILRTVMMPRDTNEHGSIFGGHILSLLDLAAVHHARSVVPKKYVTKVVREVNFISPVFVQDLVSFYAETVHEGRTSITVRVSVEALRGVDHVSTVEVTTAEVVLVAIDNNGRPIPLRG
jgi:acyl-CoA thioesterase YciA